MATNLALSHSTSVRTPDPSVEGGAEDFCQIRNRWAGAIAGAILILYAGLAWTASWTKGVSFDEGLQLAVGYNLWLNGDYRMEGANGDLVKRVATLPYLFTEPRFPSRDDPAWKGGVAYDLGHRFLFELGNSPESLLRQGRAMLALIGIAAGYLIFAWARKLYGNVGGLLALALFAVSPHMLAFGGIVSTDLSIVLTLFASTWCVWTLLHRITLHRLGASLLSAMLLVLAKPTALIIVPVTAVLIAVKFVGGRPLVLTWGGREWTLRAWRFQAAVFSLLFIAHVAAAWTAIWAHNGFRYSASPSPADRSVTHFQNAYRDPVPTTLKLLLGAIETNRILPEGFWRGIDTLLANDDEHGAFLRGEWSLRGRADFFPYAIWVKTNPALFVMLIVAAFALWKSGHRSRSEMGVPFSLYDLAPHFAFIACYMAVAVTEDLNIGHRHVLPIYPSLYVIAGGAALLWRRPGAIALKSAVVLLLVWMTIEAHKLRPHYLAYFGPQAGGPANGYKHLVDSSIGWGMNLPAIKEWLEENNPGAELPVFLGYFGNDSPAHYGIEARLLPGFHDRRPVEHYLLTPGYYVISASLLQGVYTAAFGPWCKAYEERYQQARNSLRRFYAAQDDPATRDALWRQVSWSEWAEEVDIFDNMRFARLCSWLRHQGNPPHSIGHSTFIWKLDLADLQAALVGPPVELSDDPPLYRRLRVLAPPPVPGRQ